MPCGESHFYSVSSTSRSKKNHQYLIHSCVDGDNETHRPIHHSLEQYTPSLLQTSTRVHRIRHQRYGRVRPDLLLGLEAATILTTKFLKPGLKFSQLGAGDLSVSGRMNERQGGKKVAYRNLKFIQENLQVSFQDADSTDEMTGDE